MLAHVAPGEGRAKGAVGVVAVVALSVLQGLEVGEDERRLPTAGLIGPRAVHVNTRGVGQVTIDRLMIVHVSTYLRVAAAELRLGRPPFPCLAL